MYFNKVFSLETVFKTYIDSEVRMKMDKHIDQIHIKKLSHPNCKQRYCRFKKIAMIPAKEYMDKMISFSHNGAIYVYTSCIQSI